MSTVKVGDRIEKGASVLDGVVGVTDVDGDDWALRPSDEGDWVITHAGNPGHIGLRSSTQRLPRSYGPLIVTAVREPAPQVYSIPEQPEGVTRVATEDQNTGEQLAGHLLTSGPDRGMWRNDRFKMTCTWGELLFGQGPATVVPREPRTFPKLDGAPEDLRAFVGKSLMRYARADRYGHLLFAPEDSPDNARPLAYWQEVDGPLTEVFEEATGER